MTPSPILRGTLLAALAALAFGAATPFIKRFGEGLGPFSTACLLYTGAALASLGRGTTESPLRARHLPRVVLVALLGALIAPALFAWGLQRADAASAALLLNFEAIFTVALAWAFYREPLGRRVLVAAALMLAGGLVLAVMPGGLPGQGAVGLAAVAGATLAWATDNTVTRPLAELDPRQVVRAKAAIGAILSLLATLLAGEPRPTLTGAGALLLIGATGYGLSLQLYLRAQRVLGAARTGSVFALAPFVGAVVAPLLVGSEDLARLAVAGGFFLAGVWLHATEVHNHPHTHPAQEHEHPHQHDDGHHGHPHDPPCLGEHSHVHQHAPVEHGHAHGGDSHHTHEHNLISRTLLPPPPLHAARHEASLSR